MTRFRSIDDLVAWCRQAPPGSRMDIQELAEILEGLAPGRAPPTLQVESPGLDWTWAEKLWAVPAERRLGTREVLEALGRGRTWLHERMKEEHGLGRFPHRKLDGELVFTAGEVRAWIRAQEEEIHGGPMESTPRERRLEVA